MDIKPFIIYFLKCIYLWGAHTSVGGGEQLAGVSSLLSLCGLWAGFWGSNPAFGTKPFACRALSQPVLWLMVSEIVL